MPQHVLDGSARSGGEQMRHALARALDAGPDVLLLDEPSNHLDRSARRSLLARLRMAAHPPALLVLDEPTNNLDLGLRAHLLQVLHAYPSTLVVISRDEGFIQSLQPTQQLDLPAGNGVGPR